MLKKAITYKDYNGTERTEDHYFNLSEAECMEMEMGTTGGLSEMIRRIVAAQDTPAIIKIFKELILKAYGEKSPDGKRFIKSDELSKAVAGAAKFVNGIVPNARQGAAPALTPVAN